MLDVNIRKIYQLSNFQYNQFINEPATAATGLNGSCAIVSHHPVSPPGVREYTVVFRPWKKQFLHQDQLYQAFTLLRQEIFLL